MADTKGAKASRPCPICRAAATEAFRPFCSKRCADIDLGKWFTSSYVVAGAVDDDEAEGVRPALDEDPTEH